VNALSGCASVSVVTAAHDAVDVIEQAIRSVADQTLPVYEHIVVDDGSRDGTARVVEDLKAEFPHLVCLTQSRQGSAVARNRGIERATGRYIAFLDSDDWWRAGKVAAQIPFMEETGAPFTFGDYEKHDPATGRFIARYAVPASIGYGELLRGCPIGCLTVAYDQFVLGKRYMPAVARGQDWGLWLALTRDGLRARKYPGNYAVYTERSGSLSSDKLAKVKDIYSIYRAYERFAIPTASYFLARHVLSALRKP